MPGGRKRTRGRGRGSGSEKRLRKTGEVERLHLGGDGAEHNPDLSPEESSRRGNQATGPSSIFRSLIDFEQTLQQSDIPLNRGKSGRSHLLQSGPIGPDPEVTIPIRTLQGNIRTQSPPGTVNRSEPNQPQGTGYSFSNISSGAPLAVAVPQNGQPQGMVNTFPNTSSGTSMQVSVPPNFSFGHEPLRLGGEDVSAHVPLVVSQKIWSNQYININLLLKGAVELQELCEGGTIHLNKQGILESRPRISKDQVPNIERWTDAFLIFTSIYLKRYPDVSQELLQYMSIIREAASRS